MSGRFLRLSAAAAIFLTACGPQTRTPSSLLELRRQGTVLQTHEYSCGAAALATLMTLFGRGTTEMEVLRSIFGDKLPVRRARDGRLVLRALNLEDLEIGARNAGFKVVSVRVAERESLELALEALKPVIARMRLYQEYPHFVVLRDLEDGWVQVQDPGYGNVKMPVSQLFAAWEAGDRILLAIGRHPFDAWKDSEDGAVRLRRSSEDRVASAEGLSPAPLYRSVQRRMTFIGSLFSL